MPTQATVEQPALAAANTARRLSRCRFIARLGGLLNIGLGLAVLIVGWACGITSWKVVFPGYAPMAPNTAIALTLLGTALWLDPCGRGSAARTLFFQLTAGVAGLIGGLTLIEYGFGLNLHIDELIFHNPQTFVSSPTRMAAVTAIDFLLLMGALLLSRYQRGFIAGQYLALVALVSCLFNGVAYLYGIHTFYQTAFSTGGTTMAIHTCVMLSLLSVSVLLARPDWGLMSVITSPALGGVMTRRLSPAALLIPVVTGWLQWRGQQMGFYDKGFGQTLLTAINMVIFAFLIWRCGQILNAQDIKRARAESKMLQLADSMPLLVWTANAQGESDYYNQRCNDYTGMSFEQIRDGGWVSSVHPEEVRDVMERRTRAFALHEPYTMEYRFRRASDGMFRWHLAQGTPISNPGGELVRWIGTCTDIHSLKLTEAALRSSEATFQQLADSMPQIVWAASPDGKIDYYNERWFDYTGMSCEAAKDWGWQPVLHPDDLQNTVDRWTQAFTTCGPYEIEYRFRRADGVYRWHLGRARPIRDAQGAVVRWFGTCTDIEDYKRAEAEITVLNEGLEQRVRERTVELDQSNRQLATANEELKSSSIKLEQSNRELQDFTSVASHDLKEPLRKVQTFGDRLKTVSRETLNEQGRDYLDRMLNAARRMQSLIEDLLRFARVTTQAHPFLPVDLAQVTREVLSDLEVRVAETNAHVQMGYLPTIEADAVQMRQLLQNLIGNALKFQPPGRVPAVQVYAETTDVSQPGDGMLRLFVEDNGIGFDEKYLDRIFTVFQRLHGRTDYEGTGVGLAICRKIARCHGGDITARSTPGQGAAFLVTLPFRHGNENSAPIPGAEADMKPEL